MGRGGQPCRCFIITCSDDDRKQVLLSISNYSHLFSIREVTFVLSVLLFRWHRK